MRKFLKKPALFISIMFFACSLQAQWVFSDPDKGISIIYEFKYHATEEKDTLLDLNLIVKDDLLSKSFIYGPFQLNKDNVLKKEALSELLKEKYTKAKDNYGVDVISRHSIFLNKMVMNIRDTIKESNTHSFVFQGINMFKSLLNGATRESGQGVQFTVFDGYISALNSFVCEEEVVLNIPEFKAYLEDRKKTDKDNAGIGYYLGALANETAETLNFVQVNQRLNTYFDQVFAKWPQGGQCGCCGNYSGNCYYWNSACLAHDMACQRCQHSWCFSGCVPSSCSGNTISWYWWLI